MFEGVIQTWPDADDAMEWLPEITDENDPHASGGIPAKLRGEPVMRPHSETDALLLQFQNIRRVFLQCHPLAQSPAVGIFQQGINAAGNLDQSRLNSSFNAAVQLGRVSLLGKILRIDQKGAD